MRFSFPPPPDPPPASAFLHLALPSFLWSLSVSKQETTVPTVHNYLPPYCSFLLGHRGTKEEQKKKLPPSSVRYSVLHLPVSGYLRRVPLIHLVEKDSLTQLQATRIGRASRSHLCPGKPAEEYGVHDAQYCRLRGGRTGTDRDGQCLEWVDSSVYYVLQLDMTHGIRLIR